MAFLSLNLIKELLETNLFGSTLLLGLFVVAFLVIIILVTRNFVEVALMIPFPLIIALAEAGIIPFWVKPMLYIIAGFYLSIIILILTGLINKWIYINAVAVEIIYWEVRIKNGKVKILIIYGERDLLILKLNAIHANILSELIWISWQFYKKDNSIYLFGSVSFLLTPYDYISFLASVFLWH